MQVMLSNTMFVAFRVIVNSMENMCFHKMISGLNRVKYDDIKHRGNVSSLDKMNEVVCARLKRL